MCRICRCVATGRTREETCRRIAEADRLPYRSLQEDGLPVPEPQSSTTMVKTSFQFLKICAILIPAQQRLPPAEQLRRPPTTDHRPPTTAITMNALPSPTAQTPGANKTPRARAPANDRPLPTGNRLLPFSRPFATGLAARKRPAGETVNFAGIPAPATDCDRFGRESDPLVTNAPCFRDLATPFTPPATPSAPPVSRTPPVANRRRFSFAPALPSPQISTPSDKTRRPENTPPSCPFASFVDRPAPSAPLSRAGVQPLNPKSRVAISRTPRPCPRRPCRQFRPLSSRIFALSRGRARLHATVAALSDHAGTPENATPRDPASPSPVLRLRQAPAPLPSLPTQSGPDCPGPRNGASRNFRRSPSHPGNRSGAPHARPPVDAPQLQGGLA